MLQDLIGSFAVAAVIVAAAAGTIWLVIKFDIAKMGALVAVSILVMAAAAGCFAEAPAEDEDFDEVVVEITGVKPVSIGDELLLEVYFDYEGDELS